MTHTPPTLVACLLLGLALPASAATPKLALVIGNSAYQSLPALPNCAASANTVSSALRRAGFAVTVKSDASNGEMGSAIADFAGAAAQSTSTVLYVCGYTINYAGRDFLLPASASLDRDSDALTQGIAAKSMLDAVAAGPGAHLALLDLVTAPKSTAPPHFDSLAPPATLGFAAAISANTPPDGASALAAATATNFAKSALTLADAVAAIAQSGGGPGITISHKALSTTLWLLGGPTAAATPQPTAQSASTSTPDEANMTDADRRQIQAALLRLGYYDRQADGIFGPDTRAAIRRFQHEIGAPMTGTITPNQSAKLLSQQR